MAVYLCGWAGAIKRVGCGKKTDRTLPPLFFHQKPVGFVRHLSLAGTAAAAGVLIYFWAQGREREAARAAPSVERRL